MAFKFEKLIVWQKAMDFNEMIFTITKRFPTDERFNLISQMRRAGENDSIFEKQIDFNMMEESMDYGLKTMVSSST